MGCRHLIGGGPSHVTPYGTFRPRDRSQRGWPLNKCSSCVTVTFSATLSLVARMFLLGQLPRNNELGP